MRERMTACRECHLREAYDSPVPPAGSTTARAMLIGEAPGAEEVEEGKPFVGRSGKLLRSAIVDAGLDLADLFVTNTVLCRPPNNVFPEDGVAVEKCRHWLKEQFDFIKPEFVVAIGGKAHKFVRDSPVGITTACGIWGQWDVPWGDRVWYMATLHPSFCLRGPNPNTSNAVMGMSSEEKVILFRSHIASLAGRLGDE